VDLAKAGCERFEATARVPNQQFHTFGPCARHCPLELPVVIGIQHAHGLVVYEERHGDPNAIM
jgi:hypothetical protein